MTIPRRLIALQSDSRPLNKINASLLCLLLILGLIGALTGPILAIHDSMALRSKLDSIGIGISFPTIFYYKRGDNYLFVYKIDAADTLRGWVNEEKYSCKYYGCFTYSEQALHKHVAVKDSNLGTDRPSRKEMIDQLRAHDAGKEGGFDPDEYLTKKNRERTLAVVGRLLELHSKAGTLDQLKVEGLNRLDMGYDRWGDESYTKNPLGMSIFHILWLLPFLVWRLATIWIRWVFTKTH